MFRSQFCCAMWVYIFDSYAAELLALSRMVILARQFSLSSGQDDECRVNRTSRALYLTETKVPFV